MQSLIRRISFLVLVAASMFAQAAPLPEASPEEVGMSTERLGRLDAAMQKAVDMPTSSAGRIGKGKSRWPTIRSSGSTP